MRLLPILLALLLAGCSTSPPRPLPDDNQLAWQARQMQLAELDNWQLSGRLAIQTDHEGWHVKIDWTQQHQAYTIQLIAPLGQGAMRLQGDEHFVTLQTDDGESFSAPDPGALLQQRFGWRVPVVALRYWVLGLPAPGPHEQQLDDYGRLTRLQQGEWEVQFPDYENHSGVELPRRVFVNNHRAKVRLVVSEWQLQP